MRCTVLLASDFFTFDGNVESVRVSLSRPGSDLSARLASRDDVAGYISVVEDLGDIVGWARSEEWQDYKTLESYVIEPLRGRGIASFAASGLIAAGVYTGCPKVAVFTDAAMLRVARRVGLEADLFVQSGGDWILCGGGEERPANDERQVAREEEAGL